MSTNQDGMETTPGSGSETEETGPRLRPDLAALSGYHSPDVDVDVRLNTNESPYPPPTGFVEDLADAVKTITYNRYPDRHATALRAAVGRYLDVEPDRVFCATGSNEIIQILLLAFGGPVRRALLFDPTYTMHRHIAEITGTPCISVLRGPDFDVTVEAVEAAVAEHGPDVVFFCHPNNPTGRVESRSVVELAAADPQRLVIIDEAYVEFAESSMLDLARERPNVVVSRTMSKAWAMPALRVGYMVASPELVGRLGAAQLPYHLQVLAQAAGLLALRYESDMRARVAAIVAERDRVAGALTARADIEIWPSQSNFVLMRTDRPADDVWQGLVDRGVLVRNTSGWRGTDGCLRVTIGTPIENDRFLDALGQTLTGSGGR